MQEPLDENSGSESDDRLSFLSHESTYSVMRKEELEKLRNERAELDKNFAYTPQADIYRSMAIGVYGGSLYWTCGVACAIASVQILIPFFLYGNLRHYVRTHEFLGTYHLMQEMYANRTSMGNLAAPGHSSEDDFLTWAWNDRPATVLVEKKLVGFLFILLVFLHVDRSLLDYDTETMNLRRFFPDYSKIWLWLGVLANGFNAMVIGLIIAQFFEECDTVLSLVVESLALLFLMNIDDLRGGINFGVSEAVFADVVEQFRRRWYEEFLSRDEKHKKLVGAKYHDNDVEDEPDVSSIEINLHDDFHGTNLILILFRFINLVLLCIEVPLYVTVSAGEEIPDASRGFRRQCPSFFMLVEMSEHWDGWCFLMVTLILGANIGAFCLADPHSRRSMDYLQVEKKDFLGFISKVILRRPDPRWQKRVAFEVATQDLTQNSKKYE